MSKKREIAKHLKANPKMIANLIKLYNKLCVTCRAKVQRNPGLPYNQYCEVCRSWAHRLLEHE